VQLRNSPHPPTIPHQPPTTPRFGTPGAQVWFSAMAALLAEHGIEGSGAGLAHTPSASRLLRRMSSRKLAGSGATSPRDRDTGGSGGGGVLSLSPSFRAAAGGGGADGGPASPTHAAAPAAAGAVPVPEGTHMI
jgi:hypothetical protein